MLKLKLILSAKFAKIILRNTIFGIVNFMHLFVKTVSLVSGFIIFSIITILAFGNDVTMETLKNVPVESLKQLAQAYWVFYSIAISVLIIYVVFRHSRTLIDSQYKEVWDKYQLEKNQILAKAKMKA
ncbi:hypothetical protein ACN08N_25840 (plasmid) [Photobacterium leiognathi subsp. mandapamensis]|uniref:hypothetical protein n=1 Tax=Photobacterium leiognathi TaxID=553611 RepID=UPI003AF334A9